MKSYLLFIFLLVPLFCVAQPQPPDTLWTRCYGDQADLCLVGSDIEPTFDGGFIFAAQFPSVFWRLVKLNGDGDTLWTRRYWQEGANTIKAVHQTSDSGIVFTGKFDNNRVFIGKVNRLGVTQWSRIIDWWTWASPQDVRQTSDGGFVALATLWPEAGALMRLSSVGDTVWTRRIVPLDSGMFSRIHETPDNGCVIAGTGYHLGNREMVLSKVDAAGNVVWTRGYLWSASVTGLDAAPVGFVLSSYVWVASGYYRTLLLKVNDTGDSLWSAVADSTDGGCDVLAVSGGYLIGDSHGGLTKIQEDGQLGWRRRYEWPLGTLGQMRQTPDGGFILCGYCGIEVIQTCSPLVVRYSVELDAPELPTTAVPTSVTLYTNYPNPFNPTTEIRFDLPHEVHTTLKVFDVLGREVATLVEGRMNAGEHRVRFDGTNLPSGVYFYRMVTDRSSQTKKMLLLK